ncbi:MAG TPA: hypothetical protein VIC26_11170 [Marinagarivorans sp.]
MNHFRATTSLSKLSLALGFVLSLVCFWGAQASSRVDQRPLSVADQLWYSAAANSSHFAQRFKEASTPASDGLFDNAPDAHAGVGDWPALPALATACRYRLLPSALWRRDSFQQPQPRAPPVV